MVHITWEWDPDRADWAAKMYTGRTLRPVARIKLEPGPDGRTRYRPCVGAAGGKEIASAQDSLDQAKVLVERFLSWPLDGGGSNLGDWLLKIVDDAAHACVSELIHDLKPTIKEAERDLLQELASARASEEHLLQRNRVLGEELEKATQLVHELEGQLADERGATRALHSRLLDAEAELDRLRATQGNLFD